MGTKLQMSQSKKQLIGNKIQYGTCSVPTLILLCHAGAAWPTDWNLTYRLGGSWNSPSPCFILGTFGAWEGAGLVGTMPDGPM